MLEIHAGHRVAIGPVAIGAGIHEEALAVLRVGR